MSELIHHFIPGNHMPCKLIWRLSFKTGTLWRKCEPAKIQFGGDVDCQLREVKSSTRSLGYFLLDSVVKWSKLWYKVVTSGDLEIWGDSS